MVPSEGMVMGVQMPENHQRKRAHPSDCEIALIHYSDQPILYQILSQELKNSHPLGFVDSINRLDKVITICDPDSGAKYPISYQQLIVTPHLPSNVCLWLSLLDSATKLQKTVPSKVFPYSPSTSLKQRTLLKKNDHSKLSIEPQSEPSKVPEELRDRLAKSSSPIELQVTF